MFWHQSFVWQEPIKTIILCWKQSSVWQENSCFTLCVAGELIKTIIQCWNHSSVWKENSFFTLCVAGELISYSVLYLAGTGTKNISCSDITHLWQKLKKKYFVFWHHSSVWQELIKAIILCWHHSSEWQKNSVPMSVFCKAGEFQFWYHTTVWKKNS